jgi:hypothetical protein
MPTRHKLVLQFMLALAANSDVTTRVITSEQLLSLAGDMADAYLAAS